ncbi:MAG: hypothetical protein CM1200mP16_04450 [Nitrospina sp.]|nr:MAG: hypothetical protein CM1200mP16_04450 [Nitrospina sp.]
MFGGSRAHERKEIDKIIEILSDFGDPFYLVQVNPQRGETPERLKEKFKKFNKIVQVQKVFPVLYRQPKKLQSQTIWSALLALIYRGRS